jgi:hypothetical protein
MTVVTERRRVMDMMAGEQDIKQLFHMQNSTQVRLIAGLFVKDDEEINEIVELAGEE